MADTAKPTYQELENRIRQLENQLQRQKTAVTSLNSGNNEDVYILIIDDDDSVRNSLANYLEDSGFMPITAADGKQGIDVFDNKKVDLVLLDLRMPEMDGYDVINHIHDKSPQTPLIVVSGAGGIQDAIETMKIGAWDYIVKPIKEMSSLIHSIERALEHSRALAEKNQAQQLFLQSEKNYSRLIETTTSGFWQVDKDEITTGVNNALCTMLGYSSSQIIGKSAADFVHGQNKAIFNRILTDPDESKSKHFSIILKTNNGEELNALFDAALILDNNNKISGAFAFVSNITGRKKNQQLETAIETAGAICHELHQPMQSIFGSVELLFLKLKKQDKAYEFLTIIKESIDRMSRITDQLSNITQYKTKKYIDKTIVDLEKSSDQTHDPDHE